MALPLLRCTCRRPLTVLTPFLRFDRTVLIKPVTKRPLTAVVPYVRCYSSDHEGHTHKKVVVVGIPNPLIWLRTRICIFWIQTYFDKEFSIEEFTDGAKQAFSHVTRLLSQCEFEALEGLVAKDLIGKLETISGNLSLSHKRALFADPDEIMYTTPEHVKIYYSDNGRKFVSILMRFWYLTNAQLPENTLEEMRIFQMAVGDKRESSRLLTANYEFQREFTQGVSPDWTITRIEHSKLFDLND